jgi:hypothetical protein
VPKRPRRLRELDRQAPQPHVSSRFAFQDPVDLRGLPAVGRNVTGAIRGTKPGERLE